MTAQVILTVTILLTVSIFVLSFIADLLNTIHKAWKNARPIIKQLPVSSKLAPKTASLDWIKPQGIEEEHEQVNIIELARIRPPSKKPVIVTLPQTEVAKQLEQWLTTTPIDYSTPLPEYSIFGSKFQQFSF